MTRLSDFRKVRPGSLILDDVTVADLVAALQEEGVGEVVELDWTPASTADGRFVEFDAGRYLVVRIDGETE